MCRKEGYEAARRRSATTRATFAAPHCHRHTPLHLVAEPARADHPCFANPHRVAPCHEGTRCPPPRGAPLRIHMWADPRKIIKYLHGRLSRRVRIRHASGDVKLPLTFIELRTVFLGQDEVEISCTQTKQYIELAKRTQAVLVVISEHTY